MQQGDDFNIGDEWILSVLQRPRVLRFLKLIADESGARYEAATQKILQEKFLTTNEACKLLHITRPTLDKRVKEGILNKHTKAGQIRYLYSEVMAAQTYTRYKRNFI